MTDQEQKALRNYCAFLLNEYGFDFSPNNPVIPALYIIHKEMELNNRNNKAIGSLIQTASSKINPQVFNFQYQGEAWKFQMGIAIKWILWLGLALLLVWGVAWYSATTNVVDYARIIIGSSDSVSELMKRATLEGDGNYYIYFTRAKADSIQRFTEFQRVNATTIRIKLGGDEKSKP